MNLDIADNVSVAAGGSSPSDTFEPDGPVSVAYETSGSGTLGTAKLQVSYDGGTTWHDAPEGNASSSNGSDVLNMPDTQAPLARLHVSESGGTNGITIDDARAYAEEN